MQTLRDPLLPATEVWISWPVSWSAVWVGALASLASALILGLIGTALGAASMNAFSSWQTISRIDVAMAIFGAFFAFAIGGWVSGKISGARYSEPTILHAAISWLVALPLLMLLLAAGGGAAFGGWYGSILHSSMVAAATNAATSADAARNGALAAVTTILVGLIGTVIGGWMASGEPMNFTHHRQRT